MLHHLTSKRDPVEQWSLLCGWPQMLTMSSALVPEAPNKSMDINRLPSNSAIFFGIDPGLSDVSQDMITAV